MAEKKEAQYAVVEMIRGTDKIVDMWWFDARKDARDYRDRLRAMKKYQSAPNTVLKVQPMKRGPRA